jgi:YfiH family protein
VAPEHLDVDLGGATARFTLRGGGVSTGAYASLNLGPFTDDDPSAVAENRRRVAAAAGVALAGLRQVHGTRVVDAAAATDGPPEADGVVTARPGSAPTVLVADCLPVVVAGDGVVGAFHAGWRGLAGGVLEEGVRAMRALGAAGPLRGAIGPGAGVCCYEVGEEVGGRFGAAHRRGRHLDLKAVARQRLLDVGVTRVEDLGICTLCDARCFSHRRDGGVTGRQAGIGWLHA